MTKESASGLSGMKKVSKLLHHPVADDRHRMGKYCGGQRFREERRPPRGPREDGGAEGVPQGLPLAPDHRQHGLRGAAGRPQRLVLCELRLLLCRSVHLYIQLASD